LPCAKCRAAPPARCWEQWHHRRYRRRKAERSAYSCSSYDCIARLPLLYVKQLHIENERRIRRDDTSRAPFAVGEFGWNNQRAPAAHFHARHALVPALDHPPRAERERERPAAHRAVELLAAVIRRLRVIQPAGVIHLDGLARDGLLPLANGAIGFDEAVGRGGRRRMREQ